MKHGRRVVEGVPRASVHVDLGARVVGERRADALGLLGGQVRVGLAKVEHDWRVDLSGEVELIGDARAVVRHDDVGLRGRGDQIRQTATHAEAE